MFDILVFLFENYHPEPCPEPDTLVRQLSAAGFGDDDISEALDWLADLESAEGATVAVPESGRAVRVFDTLEQAKLTTAARGFLHFLAGNAALDPLSREAVVERAMALPEESVSLATIKVIVLMVLWRRHRPLDTLLVEELLAEDDEEGESQH